MKNLIQISVIVLSLSMPFCGKAMESDPFNNSSAPALYKQPYQTLINPDAFYDHTGPKINQSASKEFFSPEANCDDIDDIIDITVEPNRTSAFPLKIWSVRDKFDGEQAYAKSQRTIFNKNIIYPNPVVVHHPKKIAITGLAGMALCAGVLKCLQYGNGFITKTAIYSTGATIGLWGATQLLRYGVNYARHDYTFAYDDAEVVDVNAPYGGDFSTCSFYLRSPEGSGEWVTTANVKRTPISYAKIKEATEYNKTVKPDDQKYENYLKFRQKKFFKQGLIKMAVGGAIALAPLALGILAKLVS